MRRAIKTITRRAGIEVSQYRPAATRRAVILKSHEIDIVLDVGASKGSYGAELRRSGYAGTIISFEPLDDAFRELALRARADPRWHCHRVALGERMGAAELGIASNSASSSLPADARGACSVCPGSCDGLEHRRWSSEPWTHSNSNLTARLS